MASFGAWEKIRKIEPSIGFDELIAIEGANQNLTVDELPEEVKEYAKKTMDMIAKK